MKQLELTRAPQLVFVPTIGFRPRRTRTLREPAETTANGTKLMLLAVAAAPERTDVVIEWERTGDPATCPPDSELLVHTNLAPLEKGARAELVVGTSRLNATTMRRRGYHLSHDSIGAVDALSFPAPPQETGACELHLSDGAQEWRVPFALGQGDLNATAIAVEVEREGIAVRATALGRHKDEVIIELEVDGPQQIRQVGAAIPTPVRFSSRSEDDYRARLQGHRRVFGERSRPITLEDDRGNRVEEVRRTWSQEPQQAAPGQPFTSRFSVAFEAPSTDVKRATLVIPFVEMNDFQPSTTADLREVPLDLELGGHHFRVVAVEEHGDDQRKIVLELPPSTAAPRFVQPARLHGSAPEFAWERHALEAGRDAIWMATKVGDPPIVTFTGAVLRVDGPLRLEIPLS